MGAEKGSVVTVSFTCRLEDGTPLEIDEEKTLTVVPGEGRTLPTLERGILGMEPGEKRVVEVPAEEVNLFLRTRASATHPAREHRPGFGYDFGPGEGGDVLLTMPPPPVPPPRQLPRGTTRVFFEVTMPAQGGAGKK